MTLSAGQEYLGVVGVYHFKVYVVGIELGYSIDISTSSVLGKTGGESVANNHTLN